jgi:hypothetical protein
MLGSIEHLVERLIGARNSTERSRDFIARIEQFAELYNRQLEDVMKSVVMIEHNGSMDASGTSRATRETRKH